MSQSDTQRPKRKQRHKRKRNLSLSQCGFKRNKRRGVKPKPTKAALTNPNLERVRAMGKRKGT
jgi:hypothetical protein